MFTVRLLLMVTLIAAGFAPPAMAALREPVHPRRNVETFTPVAARFVRFVVRATNRGEPCLDELEIYPDDNPARNVALAATGARATSSGSLAGYAIHQLAGVNDGRYGNGRSWIADRIDGAWIQVELPAVTRISRVVWGRDREGNFIDRLATRYELQVAVETNAWITVATSADREPLPAGARQITGASIARSIVNRFAPVGTSLSPEAGGPASEYRIDVWQTPDGLPGNTVTAIQQTPDGYLWVGTLNGLVRFDGLRFRGFEEDAALPNNRVLALLAARDGSLWIGTDGGGLVRRKDGRTTGFTHREGLRSDTITALAEDRTGRLWVGTPAGLDCLVGDRIVASPDLTGQPVSVVAVDRDDILWVVSANRLLARKPDGTLDRPDAADPSSFSSVLAAEAGRSGRLWFGGPNGYIGAVSNGTVAVYREQPGQLLEATWALCESRQGDLWAGTANGGLRRLRNGRFTSLTTQEGLSDNSVRCLLEDREGSLWVGTVGGGLNRVKPRRVTTYTTRDGLAHNVVMSLAEDADGNLWVGSNCGGLTVRRNGVFAPFYANYLLDNECIWSLLPDSGGALWAGTWGGGLFRLRGKDVDVIPVNRPGNDEPLVALAHARAGGLWLGLMPGGVKRFRDGMVVDGPALPGRPPHPVTAVLEEPDGTLWVGTSGSGLHRLGPAGTNTLTRHQGLPGDIIRTLHRDAAGTLWVGTAGGLARIRNHAISAFTRLQGLPDDVISQILEDDRGNFWFGCNQGIFRVPRADLESVADGRTTRVNPITYGRPEGMEGLECTGGFQPAGLKTRDGRLWFSTVKGLVMIDPATIALNELPPPVVIEEMLVDGRRVSPGATSEAPAGDGVTPARAPSRSPAGPIGLEPGWQRIEFQFTALSLVAPERNRFKYRLAGLEDVWLDAGASRVASYPHLPPGTYEFQVIAGNNDGIWNETGARLPFEVRPRLWQTWWFRTLAVSLLLGGLAWVIRSTALYRLRWKLRRLEEQHAVETERTRIAQDIHDELGANLTRIALLTEMGQKHRDRPDEVAADLDRISVTAREAVRAMDAIVWAVNPRNDSLDHFANYVSQFAEEFFRPTSIRCRLDIPADLPEHPLSTEARHHLFLAVKEALNNVVRHSGASEVWLRLGMQHGNLDITITDNGHGIDPARPAGGGHDGLANIRRRVEGLGGRFALTSDPARGTSLVLSLPLRVAGGGSRA